jgi:hypothetical protein
MDIAISVVLSGCSLVVAVYGLIYKHVSSIHKKIDAVAKHMHAHDTSDATIQTALQKDVAALEKRVSHLEQSAA